MSHHFSAWTQWLLSLLLIKAQILALECNLFLSDLTFHHSTCCYFFMFLSKELCICFFFLESPIAILMALSHLLQVFSWIIFQYHPCQLYLKLYLLAHLTIPLIYYQSYFLFIVSSPDCEFSEAKIFYLYLLLYTESWNSVWNTISTS